MKKILLALVGVGSLGLSGPGAWAWQRSINGTADFVDVANAVTVDAGGGVVAAGSIVNDGRDFTVVKLAGADGAEVWRYVIAGTGLQPAQARAVTVNAAGDVVAAGDAGGKFTVVKLAGATGAELWRQDINGTAGGGALSNTVTVDGAGDVVAAGYTTNAGTSRDFTVVKLSGADGTEAWRQVIDGTAHKEDTATAVTVDGAGDVVAAGNVFNADTNNTFTVVKFAGATGAEVWRRFVVGTVNEGSSASGVTVDAGGDVLAVGITVNVGTSADFTVVKLAGADGAELWRQNINGSLNGGDGGNAVTVDAGGDVVAAGRTFNEGTGLDFTVVKLAGATGAELWRQNIHRGGTPEEALAVKVDSAGDVVASGHTSNTPQITDFDFTVVKLAGATGAELWRKVTRGTASNSANDALTVVVDGAGDVVAAGFLTNTDTNSDFTVIKVRGTDGSDF